MSKVGLYNLMCICIYNLDNGLAGDMSVADGEGWWIDGVPGVVDLDVVPPLG